MRTLPGQIMKLSVETKPGVWSWINVSAYVLCNEKAALLAAYQRAAEEYTRAVAELGRAVGAVLHSEYELVQRRVAKARELSRQAHTKLEEH
jgi:hypothetical protein